MRVLITGAAGFISRELVTELEQGPQAHDITLFDRVAAADATVFVPGSAERKALPLDTSRWRYIQGELLDPLALRAALAGQEAVIHLAAAVSGLPEYGVDTFQINAMGTFQLLDLARQMGIQRFLVASSVNAFGTFYWRVSGTPVTYERLPLDETFAPIPEDPYSLSKLVNEETCAAFARAYHATTGLTTAALRFAGMWSTEQYAEAMAHPLPPTTEWSADLYHWAHIADIVRGIRQALEAPVLPPHGVYTLSAADTRCPEPTMHLLERFQPHLLANLSTPIVGREALLSIARAHATFDYTPQYRLGD